MFNIFTKFDRFLNVVFIRHRTLAFHWYSLPPVYHLLE